MRNPGLIRIVSTVAAATVSLLAAGCRQAPSGHLRSAATAPVLTSEGQSRRVSDPNAPFVLIDRTVHPAPQPASPADPTAAPCNPSTLGVSEISAAIEGDVRSVRLAFANLGGAPCEIGGFPSVALLDENGDPVAGILVRQVGASQLAGSIVAQVEQVTEQPAARVILQSGGEAVFQLGWTSGDQCPVVSRFLVSVPGAASTAREAFTIDHALTVCGGQLRVTALANEISGNSPTL